MISMYANKCFKVFNTISYQNYTNLHNDTEKLYFPICPILGLFSRLVLTDIYQWEYPSPIFFPFVCSSFVLSLHSLNFTSKALLQSFALKFLKWLLTWQPCIRKHSYLGHEYLDGSVSDPRVHAPG